MNTIMVDGTGDVRRLPSRLAARPSSRALTARILTVTSLILTVQFAAVPCTRHTERAAVERREEHCNLFKKEVIIMPNMNPKKVSMPEQTPDVRNRTLKR